MMYWDVWRRLRWGIARFVVVFFDAPSGDFGLFFFGFLAVYLPLTHPRSFFTESALLYTPMLNVLIKQGGKPFRL